MKIDTAINMTANGLLAGGVSCFMVMLYRTEGVVNKWPMVGSLFLRLSLTATAAGALFNCLTASTPAPSEIMLNCGLACIFVWGVMFHSKLIKKDLNGPTPKHQPGPDEGSPGQTNRPEGPNQ